VQFDDETLAAIEAVARDRGSSFQEIAEWYFEHSRLCQLKL
jgi:hypothetical protein